jgi:WD40 repeat protein
MSSTIVSASSAGALVLGDPHLHTDGDVLALAFGSDGSLWSVEEAGVVRRWNAVNGQQLGWQGLSDLETLWGFSSDARVLAAAGNDLSLWNPLTGQLLAVLPQASWVTALAFHAGGRLLATGHDDGSARCWDLGTRRLLFELRLHRDGISALAFSVDGSRLASAGEDRLIGLWDTAAGQHLGTLAGHIDRIPALAWHPDGRQLVSAGWDTSARVWDVSTHEPVILFNCHAAQVLTLGLSPDGKLLACADSAHDLYLWDFAGRKILHKLHEPDVTVYQLAFSPDGQRLACAGEGRVIRLWDPVRGLPLSAGGAPTLARMTIAVSPDGTRLASNGGGTALRVWDTTSRQALLHLEEEGVTHALAWGPDGAWIAGGTDRHIRLWEAANGRPAAVLEGPDEPITALAFARDGKTLASASGLGLSVWLWRVADGEPILLIPDALDGCVVTALAFHPAGRLLAAGGIDWLATGGSTGAVSLWDIVDRCEVATFPGGSTALAFDPAGAQLAATTLDQTLCIWDIKNKELLIELVGHEDTVNAVAYSPDGRWLASGSDDSTVRLWDAGSGALHAVQQLDSQVKVLCFSPDGRRLFTGNGNTTCSVLAVKDLQMLAPSHSPT